MMKTNITPHILLNETIKQQERYEKLYGIGDYADIIAKNMKRTKWLIVGFILIVAFLSIMQLYRLNLSNQGITLDSNGNITSIIRPEPGSPTIVMDAEIVSDSGRLLTEQGIKLTINPISTAAQQELANAKEQNATSEDAIQQEIRKAVYQINSGTTEQTVELPLQLSDGTKIYWVPKNTKNVWIIPFVIMIGCYAIYYNRDAGLAKKEMAAKESVLLELPEFVNKVVLLLNAGLILSNAFKKIVSDFERTREVENNYFYGQLSHIILKCQETNESVQKEIRTFAVRTGVVEFMRLSNIINDSMTKGSDLMTQLKMEGDNLWAARRKKMEEKGKLAETKLTFPLVILLLVLLMITIAPAMMEM